jgi:prepilin-type processing-associated H-X9-DG protein
MYAFDNHDVFPRTIYQSGDIVIPNVSNAGFDSPDAFGTGTTVPANCIPSALFLLLREEDVKPRTFICPGTNGFPDAWADSPDVLKRSNFTDLQQNLTYSYANPYPDNAAAGAGYKLGKLSDPGMAIVADRNPGSSVLSVSIKLSPIELRKANSRNHNGEGQNVLYADGHVEFQVNPFCGLNNDNIYCRGPGGPGTAPSDLINSPQNKYDSVLLPADSQ